MSDQDPYCVQDHAGSLMGRCVIEPHLVQPTMNAKLTDIDRRAVDFLLDGEDPSLRDSSPMARNAFMDRVQAVRRLLSRLDAMPAEAPSMELIEATLAHTPMVGQDQASDTAGSQPAA